MAKKVKRLILTNLPTYKKFGKKTYERNAGFGLTKAEVNKKAKEFRNAKFLVRVVRDKKLWNLYHFPTTKTVMKAIKKSKKR